LFSGEGDIIKLDSVYRMIDSSDVVLYGYDAGRYETQELGNHLLEKLYSKNKNVQLGTDYFFTTHQVYIDDYLQGYTSNEEMRKKLVRTGQIESWRIDFMNFARRHRLDFIATKLHRSIYSKVYAASDTLLENTLSSHDQLLAAPYPFPIDTSRDAYSKNFHVEDGVLVAQDKNKVIAESFVNATAAYFINKTLKKNHIFFHLNDKSRIEKNRGINWQLEHINDSLRTTTITFLSQKEYLADKNKTYHADVVFVIPSKKEDGAVGGVVEKVSYFYEFNGKEIIIPEGDDF